MPRRPNTVLIYEKIPVHLRDLREQAGLTQRELANRLKKPQSWGNETGTGEMKRARS